MSRAVILSGMLTHKLERGTEMGVWPIDRLDASTLSRGKTHNRVTIRTSEWENPSSGVGFTVAFEWGCDSSKKL